MIEKYLRVLNEYALSHTSDLRLYEEMNGMPLREMDKIIYPVCTLCRDHERAGFVAGIKVGMRLLQELVE